MGHEIELKLAIAIRETPPLRRHPLLAAHPSLRRWVHNIYLDTPNLRLRQQRIAVRRRQIGEKWLLTVKTAASSLSGLSRRLEWEYPLDPERLDFQHVDDPDIRNTLKSVAPQLQPAFRTDFIRTSWVVQQGQGQLEVALDLGYIRTATHRKPLHEVELELLNGPEQCLQEFADLLQKDIPLTPLAPSKAARGYALLNSEP